MKYCIMGTWAFSEHGIRLASNRLSKGVDAMEAAVTAAQAAEKDPNVHSVGYGSIPNRDGDLELDAAVMDGRTLHIGAVIALKGYMHPSRIAMELWKQKKYTVLAGEGADIFARSCGHEKQLLLTRESMENYHQKLKELKNQLTAYAGHDTVGVIARDQTGAMCTCTSTSGIYLKHPGRVGDTPLVGGGFYVDDDIGAAVATGVGEEIMKGCLCYDVVQRLRTGVPPYQAAREAVMQLHHRLDRRSQPVGNMAVLCMNRDGVHAGACNHDDFCYFVASDQQETIRIDVPAHVQNKSVMPIE